jgi:glutamate--cysteine ligase
MSRDQAQDPEAIRDIDQLVEYFRLGEKAEGARGIGTEHEKFVFRKDLAERPLIEFDGEHGIEEMFGAFEEKFGWEASKDAGRTVALVRGHEAITLEPAGQLELSGAVTQTIFETADEFDQHMTELGDVAGDYAAVCMWGMNPFDPVGDLPWMPKSRYGIMRAYLPTRGDLAHWMMQTTCTIQANVDYTSEADAVDIIHTSVLISPIVNAIFANSPLKAGEPSGYQSYRAHIWTRTDDDRSGVPDFMYRDDFGFEDYVEYALDVPMFFIRRDSGYVDMSGKSFRQFLRDGWEGTPATMGDFELHLSTLFPEVRLKRFIELRCGDGGPREHVLGLPALWKGLLYDPTARQEARELIGLRGDDHRALFDVAAREGIHAKDVDGRPMLELARRLVAIAGEGLDRLAAQAGHDSERVFLEPIATRLDRGESLADQLLAEFAAVDGDRAELIARADALA